MVEIEPRVEEAIAKARVARLATVDDEGQPHLVPVVFVFYESTIFIALDEKSKKVRPQELRRVKNIKSNPNVALLIDKYSEDWSELSYVMILGKAGVIGAGEGEEAKNRKDEEQQQLLAKVHELLTSKYPQYERVGIGNSCIVVKPERVVVWRNKEGE